MLVHSEETWQQHDRTFRSLPGAQGVIDWYGDVPGFHDADLVNVILAAEQRPSLAIRFWRLEPTARNERVLQPVDKRTVVFTFSQIVDLELESFGPRTELNAVRIAPAMSRDGRPRFSLASPASDDIDIIIEPHYGLSGWLRCRDVRVELGS